MQRVYRSDKGDYLFVIRLEVRPSAGELNYKWGYAVFKMRPRGKVLHHVAHIPIQIGFGKAQGELAAYAKRRGFTRLNNSVSGKIVSSLFRSWSPVHPASPVRPASHVRPAPPVHPEVSKGRRAEAGSRATVKPSNAPTTSVACHTLTA